MGNYISTIQQEVVRIGAEEGYYDIIPFFYDNRCNQLIDENGWVVYDIFRYITPNLWFLFKYKKETMYIHSDKDGVIYEFNYPDEEWDGTIDDDDYPTEH